MAWYNSLLSWIGNGQKSVEKMELYCDNPGCLEVIQKRGRRLRYNERHQEIYHGADCGNEASDYRKILSGIFEVQRLDFLSYENALKLRQEGKLKQSKRLEEEIKTLN